MEEGLMATVLNRDAGTDYLLTPKNSALVLIDYQPALVDGTNSIDRDVLMNNVVAMAKAAKMYDLPIVLSTIGVEAGYQQDTVPEVKEILGGIETIDRGTTVDAHEGGMQRLVQAGAVPVTWEAVMAELGRLGSYDVAEFVEIMNEHLPKSLPQS